MKTLKYVITAGVIIFVAYHSVYFKKLDEVKAAQSAKEFNAQAYVQKY